MIETVSAVAASRATLDADAAAYLALWAPAADATHETAIDAFFVGLKADGIYTKLDEFWILGNQHEQAALLGCKGYKNCTAVNAPAFVADRGYSGALGKYLNTNLVLSTDGVQYTINNCSVGVYVRTDASLTSYNMGAAHTGEPLPPVTIIQARHTNGNFYAQVNTELNFAAAAVPSSLGLFVARRTAANAQQAYRNGAEVATGDAASTVVPGFAAYICAYNRAGVVTGEDTRQHSFAYIGAAMTATQQANLFTRVEALGDALGWGVI